MTAGKALGSAVLAMSLGGAAVSLEAALRDGQRPAEVFALSPLERVFLIKKSLAEPRRIRVLMLAKEGRVSELAGRITRESGEVLMQEPDVDFLRASVPVAAIDALRQAPELAAFRLEMGSTVNQMGVSGEDRPQPSRKFGRPPSVYTTLDNPYTGGSSTESVLFKTQHPTYDGRGVAIGGVEAIDPRTPSLAQALSLDGSRIPKVLDYIMLPPSPDVLEPAESTIPQTRAYGWHATIQVARSPEGSQVDFAGHSFKLPREVKGPELRMAQYHIKSAGIPPELTLLWSVDEAAIWILENGTLDFARALRVELPRTAHRAAIAAMKNDEARTVRVAVDLPTRTLGLNLSTADHGTMCASVAAGHSFLNSRAEGVAPAAQWLALDNYNQARDWESAQPRIVINPWLMLFRDPRVDLISNSTAIFSGRPFGMDDTLLDWQLFSRMTAKYPKLFISAVGNGGPQADDVDGGSSSSDFQVSIGAYTPLETWQANYGITPKAQHTPAPFSAYGPADDGGLKPELLGLTATLAAARVDEREDWRNPYYDMPDGYILSAGTSAASPNAAGHVALLISAAKQAGIPHDPQRLRVALFSSAKFLDGVEARVQGHGLIQIAQAWDALKRIRDFVPPRFQTRAPVRTFHSPQFASPNQGRGIYEREGWAPNQSGDRQITVTRTTGSRTPINYMLRWRGDTDSFSSPISAVSLSLGKTLNVPVHIRVKESRAYSAILDLVDPDLNVTVHSVLCTVIAAEQLTAGNGFSAEVSRVAPRPGHGFMFVRVPEGANSVRVQVEQHGGRNMTLQALMPTGELPKSGEVTIDDEGSAFLHSWRLLASDRTRYDQTFVRPAAGVWQFWLSHDNGTVPDAFDPNEPQPVGESTFTMRVTAVGGAPGNIVIAKSQQQATIRFTNRLGPIADAEFEAMGLGEARTDDPIVKPGLSPLLYDVTVPPGTSKLTAEVDGQADISLVIFQVTNTGPKPVNGMAQEIGPGGRKYVVVSSPKPGTYKIVVDAWRGVPSQGLRIHYQDALFHQAFGDVKVQGKAATLASGERLEAEMTWVLRRTPEKGRTSIVEVGIFSPAHVSMRSNYRELVEAGKSYKDQTITSTRVAIATQSILLPR
jgi:hypothetical protein